MGDKNIKLIRKQLRNVAQEMAPKILTAEVQEQGLQIVRKEMHARLDAIESNVKEALAQLDGRQKDMQSLILRTLTGMQQPIVSEAPQVGQELPPSVALSEAVLPHRE